MAVTASLKAQKRDGTGKGVARKTRAQGLVPAVIYGHGEENRLLTVDGHELSLLFSRVHVENTLIELEIEGEKKPVRTLVREVQRHPHRGDVLHVDFFQIHKGEKVTVQVPISLVGAAAGVKAGGLLQHARDELEVRCLADAIPDTIDVDVSALEIGENLHVRDLPPIEGIEILTDPVRTVCSVQPPIVAAVEEAEEVVEEELEEIAEPEVISRGKPEEEEAAEE